MIIKKKKTVFKFYFVFFLLLIFMFFLLYHNFILFFKFYRFQKDNFLLQQKIIQEKHKQSSLKEDLLLLDTSIGKENVIIEQTFTKKPGEEVIEIIRNNN